MYNCAMNEHGTTINAYTVGQETLSGRDFFICLGDFLDAFYSADSVQQEAMLSSPPDFSMQHEYLAFLAATVHKLANTYGHKPPTWAFEERCYLRDKPFFGCNASGNLRLLFMYTSPTEFKHRNLFVDENVLVRV